MPEIKCRLLERDPYEHGDMPEPGDMWVRKNGSIQILFPRRDGEKSNLYFNTQNSKDRATGKPWTVTGEAPNITLHPSVDFDAPLELGATPRGDSFHGWLIDGVIRW